MAEFEADYTGLRQVLLSAELRRALFPTAVRIMAKAKALAAPHVRTGNYMRSFRYETGRNTSRVYVRVVNADPASNAIEGQQHIMGKAASG